MDKLLVRLQSASGQETVGDAYTSSAPKGCADVEFIIFFQPGTVNDVDDLLTVFLPILLSQDSGNMFQLLGHHKIICAIARFQCVMNSVHVFIFQCPEIGTKGILPFACIADIEDISDTGNITSGIDQGDSLGTAPYIPPHPIVPQIILRTGRRIRTLGEDHQLLMIGIFIEPCSRGQKGSPALIAAGDFSCGTVRQLR